MARKSFESLVFILLICKSVICRIAGPTHLTYCVGEDAHFRWNNTNSSKILSVTWGIKSGGIADPQYIHVDILSNKVHFRSDMEPDLLKRLSFDGNLKKGRAWFILKNVTVNDTNEYIASISDNVKSVLPYTVELTVKTRGDDNEQSELNYITPKEPESNQVVPSRFPDVVKTTTKGTIYKIQYTTSRPYFITKQTVLLIAAPFAVLLLVLAIVALICWRRKCSKSAKVNREARHQANVADFSSEQTLIQEENRKIKTTRTNRKDTAPSENKLI